MSVCDRRSARFADLSNANAPKIQLLPSRFCRRKKTNTRPRFIALSFFSRRDCEKIYLVRFRHHHVSILMRRGCGRCSNEMFCLQRCVSVEMFSVRVVSMSDHTHWMACSIAVELSELGGEYTRWRRPDEMCQGQIEVRGEGQREGDND